VRLPVAVIARAWRTPLGDTIEAAIARLCAGERAAINDPRGGYACRAVAPIRQEPALSRQARYLRRMGSFGLEVAGEAMRASGIAGGPRVGLFSGVGGLRAHWDDMLGALSRQRDDGERMWERGLKDVHPYWMLRHLSNNVHAIASAELGCQGEGATFGGGNGGAQAIASAARALWDGAIDAALVVAQDSLLEPETLVELGARGAATVTEPANVIAPYAANAAGFVPGEAAAALVLVRDAAAPLAWIEACDGAATDEHWREAVARSIDALVPDRGPGRPAIELVDGAARAWPELDRAERVAVADLLGDQLPLVAISAAMGQLGAATAVVQTIALAEVMRAGRLPPIAGLATAAPGPLEPLTRATTSTAQRAIGLHAAAPGLTSIVRVEVPR
jgi:3-oxoacyl-(acyl-carrier-protein) synthase